MFDWFRKIINLKSKAVCTTLNPITPTTQKDPLNLAIKRTRASIKQQEISMNMRALKAHAAECTHTSTCTEDPCFKIEPDKIVSEARATQEELSRYNK